MSGSRSLWADRMRIGLSAGFTLRNSGGLGRFFGRLPPALLIAACTSSDAASMLRSRSNCTTTCVLPATLTDVICATPEIWENWRSNGCATVDAMVSGLAPGKEAVTWMVGNSTRGRGATGSSG